ncbi:MAG: hypothetical protein A2W93_02295 [Bacteroidetes bacterium GWF2_43_63]|nr:MAG: hypothetical protein A2W94_13810 [Bacteroidetes bacterium GWE2_42_42]OFY53932.1 MAG: hypothetical protein A2W93_02295 [Bacteroidetes bacterium GWF2_43_63]HBG70575.1 hypothetical protein [Bacteroidales bacterium]HCB61241.1 hypothetical protein [Bacteroidales bacterium]HCY23692.1 hypothetical protein [Bacteroidales bacterium]
MEQQTTTEKKKRKWYWIALRIFLWMLGSVVFLILLAWLLVFVFQNRIEQKVIGQINAELNSEIKVKDVDVTLFHHFPMVSVVFNDVSASDATPQKTGNLFAARWVSLEFNLMDVITGDYTIRQIGMDRGTVWLRVFEDGTDNYHILKPTTDTTASSESTAFHLERIYLSDVSGGYFDERYDQQYSFFFHQAKASGSFYEDDFNVKLSAALRVDTIHVSGMDFIPGMDALLNGVIDVNTSTENVSFSSVEIQVADVVLLAAGKVNYDKAHETVDITVNSDNTDLIEFMSLMPQEVQKFSDGLEHRGTISIESHIKGKYSDGKMPAVDVSLQMEDGYIERAENDIALSNIRFNGKFSTPDFAVQEKYFISLKNFSATLDGKTISGSVQIKNLKEPQIKLLVKGDMSLEKIQKWGQFESVKECAGNIQFDVQYEGIISDFSNLEAKDFIDSKSQGTLLIEDAKLQTEGMSKVASVKKLDAIFSNRDLEIVEMNVAYGTSDFTGNAILKDILPFLFIADNELKLSADLHSKNIDITELFPEEENTQKTEETEITFVLPKNVRAVVDYSAERLSYNKFGASNVKARVHVGENKVLAEDVSLNTLGGSIRGNGSCEMKNKDVKVSLDAELKNLDVREAFIVFNNFGQKDLTYDNLRGRADVSLQMKASFSETLEVDPASIVAGADIEIKDGQLVGYAPINDLEKIIKGRDFSDIQFEKMTSTISISDKTIRIPKTEIRSNVMNLKVTGSHTFDNNIDYHLEVKFSDVKKKGANGRPEDEYGYVVDDGVGDPTIFILITGTVENPQYKQLDKKAMQEKVKQDLKTEKQNLKKILNEEFGLFKKDTTLKKVEPEPKENTKFQIEWEE